MIFTKRNRKSKRFTEWYFPEDWDGDLKKAIRNITFDRFRRILETENINEHWILIPRSHNYFSSKWGLLYFFDPSRQWNRDFNPFIKEWAVRTCYGPKSERQIDIEIKKQMDDPNYRNSDPESIFHLYLEIDVRKSIDTILYEVKREVKSWRDWCPYIPSERGSPKRRATILRNVRDILEINSDLKELSKMQQANRIHEKIRTLTAISIMRRYPTSKKRQKIPLIFWQFIFYNPCGKKAIMTKTNDGLFIWR